MKRKRKRRMKIDSYPHIKGSGWANGAPFTWTEVLDRQGARNNYHVCHHKYQQIDTLTYIYCLLGFFISFILLRFFSSNTINMINFNLICKWIFFSIFFTERFKHVYALPCNCCYYLRYSARMQGSGRWKKPARDTFLQKLGYLNSFCYQTSVCVVFNTVAINHSSEIIM